VTDALICAIVAHPLHFGPGEGIELRSARLDTSGTIPFVLMDVAVMKPVESSISFMKNTEPPSDSVKGPSTSV